MKQYLSFLIVSICILTSLNGADSLHIMQYLDLVTNNHPLIRKANLNQEIIEAYQLKGRGALDPKIYSDFQSKDFKDTRYFNIWQTEAKIPTILPVDLSVGYERNNGQFLNLENDVPDNGLVYGTLNVSLLRGLLFDEQRYNIQKAELNGLKSDIERAALTREVIIQAIKAYITWAELFFDLDAKESFVDLIVERHQNIVELYVNGDKPAVDTIESRLTLISAEKQVMDAEQAFIKARQQLNLFLWNNEGQALQINETLQAMSLRSLVIQLNKLSFIEELNFEADPKIRKIDNAILAKELDIRLQKEALKPQLDLKYNTILNLGDNDLNPTFTFNDYKYGVAVEVPILNRKNKAEIRLNELKNEQALLERSNKLYHLQNKYSELLARQLVYDNQLSLVTEKIEQSALLLEAEQLKFSIGESSIFLLNQRERKLLEAKLELISIQAKRSNILSDIYYLKIGRT